MGDYSKEERESAKATRELSADKLVYVMPDQAVSSNAKNQVTIKELWNIVWEGKWLIVAITTAFAVISIAYALLATEWYRAEVLLAPTKADSVPSISGQLGGLAALAGVNVGDFGGGETAEAVATLESRDLARVFIESNGLMPVLLYEDWDEAGETWKVSSAEDIPDIRDAVEVFHEKVLRVQKDRESGLVTVAVEWIDPYLAAQWASKIVRLTNDRLRQRALEDAEKNVTYLQSELGTTSVVTLQQSIGRLLETEMQKLMLAKKNDEFAFRTVDTAKPPKKPSRPMRSIIVLTGLLLGGLVAVLLVFIRHSLHTDDAAQRD